MKFIKYLFLLILCSGKLSAQTVLYSTDFNNGNPGGPGMNADLENNPWNGWTESQPGFNDVDANKWFISCKENGLPVGSCGADCSTGDATLHISSDYTFGVPPFQIDFIDLGAAYLTGGGVGVVTTDRRAESPVINCAGIVCPITLKFNYMANGQPGSDYFAIDYFDGATWNQLTIPPTTAMGCAPQGTWTAFSIAVPIGGIANAQIGFHWLNNDDGAGTDPSVAIDSVMVYASGLPLASFTSPPNGCVDSIYDFINDNGSVAGVTHNWVIELFPGFFATTDVTGFSFLYPDTFDITLTETNACGSTVYIDSIIITSCATVLEANFTPSTLTICEGDSINFTNTSTGPFIPANCVWNFAGGTPSSFNGQNPGYVTYSTAGTYLIKLNIDDGTNGDDTVTVANYITVNQCPAPIVNITMTNDSVCIGGNITYTQNCTNATSYSWTFENGTPPTSNSASQNVTYNTAGIYDVTLTATGSGGSTTKTFTDTIIVYNCTVVTADFTIADDSICAGSTASFTNISTGPLGLQYAWLFPGGTPDSAIGVTTPPAITYSTPGTYTITLAAVDLISGAGDTISHTIEVHNCPVPVANFSASATNICKNDSVVFTDLSTNNTTWDWTFTGGVPASFNGQNPPPVFYANSGVYTVSLLVTDANGLDSTYQININVSGCGAPTANFVASDSIICVGDCIRFYDLSIDSPTGFAWTFYGAMPNNNSMQNPLYICYNTVGTFDVELYAFNNLGGNTLVKSNYILVNPLPDVSTNVDSVDLILGNFVNLSATGGVDYQWYPSLYLNNDSISDIIATPLQTTTYTVTITDANGCTNQKSLVIHVRPPDYVFIPNLFTPNDDKVNDKLIPYISGEIKSLELSVFDRWGSRVFFTADYTEGWDGTFQGRECNTGVYIWYYRASFIDGRVIKGKGDITLIR